MLKANMTRPLSLTRSLLVTLAITLISLIGAIAWSTPVDPFNLNAVITIEDARLLSAQGGSRPSSEQRAVIALPLTLELDDLVDSPLGQINILGLFIKEDSTLMSGRSMIDDAHGYSNLRAEDRAQLFELYWTKSYKSSTLRIGKLDANDHFAVSEHEAQLINGAAGFSPSILGMPSYPDSAWSAQLAHTVGQYDLSVGIFDGGSTTLSATPTGSRLSWSPSAKRGELFYIAQVTAHLGVQDPPAHQQLRAATKNEVNSFQQDRGFVGRSRIHLTMGGWSHQGEVAIVEDQSVPSYGLYLTSDVELMKTSRGGEVGLGAQAAWTPHVAPLHLSLAFTWSEVTPPVGWSKRGLLLSLGLSYLKLDQPHQEYGHVTDSSESLVELTATLPLSSSLHFSASWISLGGDAHNPTGAQLLVTRLTIGAI